MPNAFNFSASPFDCLNSQEQDLVRNSVDIAYFREGEIILDVGSTPTHLFIPIKGYVQQLENGEEVATYGPDDCFDGRGLIAGKVSSQFIASEEVVSYQLAKSTVTELISTNATFGALLFADLSKKLNALAERRSQYEINSLSLAQVSEAFLREIHIVDIDTSLFDVVRIFNDKRTNNVLVRSNDGSNKELGIFTTTSLQRAILAKSPLDSTPVGPLSNYKLITVEAKDHLYEALAIMIRHSVHRVIVMNEGQPIGTLEQVDLLSFIANSSSLVVQGILGAKTLDDLKEAANQITNLITLLHRNGTKVAMIGRLVQELNAKLFEKAWSLIATPDLQKNSCLFVMGSEGRGEQILKTDQDNGLILRDGYVPPHNLDALCQRMAGFEEGVSLEWLDGYMTALMSGPRRLSLDEWLPVMAEGVFERAFADPADAQAAREAIQARWDVLANQLDPEEILDDADVLRLAPLMIELTEEDKQRLVEEGHVKADELHMLEQTGEVWALGFIDATRDFPQDWPEADTETEEGQLFEECMTRVVTLTMTPEPELQFEPDPEAGYDMSAKTLEIIKASKVTKFGFVHNELYYQFDKSPNAPAATLPSRSRQVAASRPSSPTLAAA